MQAFEAADIPSAKCERRTTLTANAQIQAIGALETYVTDNLGKLTAPTPPALFAGAPTSLAEPSPNLGQHSRAIMQELDFDADDDWRNERQRSLAVQLDRTRLQTCRAADADLRALLMVVFHYTGDEKWRCPSKLCAAPRWANIVA